MPASLKAFRETFPDVEVTLLESPLSGQIADLESGAIQVGFAIKGSTPIPKNLQHVEIARSPIRAVVGRGNPLAAKTRIALADLVGEPLLCLTPKKSAGSLHGDIMRRCFVVRGLKPGPIRQIEGAEAFNATLESGMGVSLIAQIGSLSRNPNLIFRPLKDSGPDLFLELHALWRDGQTSPLTANFIAMMKKTALREKSAIKRNKLAK